MKTNFQRFQADFDTRLLRLYFKHRSDGDSVAALYDFLATRMGVSSMTIHRHLARYGYEGRQGLRKKEVTR